MKLINKYIPKDMIQEIVIDSELATILNCQKFETFLEQCAISKEDNLIIKPIGKTIILTEQKLDQIFNSWRSGTLIDHIKLELFQKD